MQETHRETSCGIHPCLGNSSLVAWVFLCLFLSLPPLFFLPLLLDSPPFRLVLPSSKVLRSFPRLFLFSFPHQKGSFFQAPFTKFTNLHPPPSEQLLTWRFGQRSFSILCCTRIPAPPHSPCAQRIRGRSSSTGLAECLHYTHVALVAPTADWYNLALALLYSPSPFFFSWHLHLRGPSSSEPLAQNLDLIRFGGENLLPNRLQPTINCLRRVAASSFFSCLQSLKFCFHFRFYPSVLIDLVRQQTKALLFLIDFLSDLRSLSLCVCFPSCTG